MRHPGQLPLLAATDTDGGSLSVRAHPRARRLTVRVYPGGAVRVTVPPGTRPATIEQFIARHRTWIERRRADFAARAAHEPLLAPLAIALRAFEEEWQVRYGAAGRRRWRVRYPGHLDVHVPAEDLPAVSRCLGEWLCEEAARRLRPWLAALAAEHGFRFERLQVRRQRTRWGSCSRSGTISLNACLLFQRPQVVRYLLLHELCHTRHMNHSRRFWALVERTEPDWRALDRELLRGWQNVPRWVHSP